MIIVFVDFISCLYYEPTPISVTVPTATPTEPPSALPTPTSTGQPSPLPSDVPIPQPTTNPTAVPTPQETHIPTPTTTGQPSRLPSDVPIPQPTINPTAVPTPQETHIPTQILTMIPVPYPTPLPTPITTEPHTLVPAPIPTVSTAPLPTSIPSSNPTLVPVPNATNTPTLTSYEEEQEEEEEDATGEYEDSGMSSGSFIEECRMNETEMWMILSDEGAMGDVDCGEVINSESVPEGAYVSLCGFDMEGIILELSVQSYSGDSKGCFEPPDGSGLDIASEIFLIDLSQENAPIDYVLTIPYGSIEECVNAPDVSAEESLSCRWYDEDKREWATNGCELMSAGIEMSDGRAGVRCRCTHLTAFAIIQDTFSLRDSCALSNVLGNTLWVVVAILYSFLGVFAVAVLCNIYLTARDTREPHNPTKVKVYCLITIVSILNITLAIILYNLDEGRTSAMLRTLSVIWSALYVFSYWIYTLVVSLWAGLVSPDHNGILRKLFGFVGICVSLVIVAMFVSIGVADEDGLPEILTAGSITVATVSLGMAVGFILYGAGLIMKLSKARRYIDDSAAVEQLGQVKRRLTIVVGVASLVFIFESVIVLVSTNSETFFENFSAFQSVYVILDLMLLSSICYLFFMNTYRTARSSSRQNISEFNVPHKEALEMDDRSLR